MTFRLDRDEARRIAVRAQRLDADRPTDLLDLVRHLTFLQLDPTAAVAPSADLIAWSRLGNAYRPADLVAATERDRQLFETFSTDDPRAPGVAMLRPMADLPLLLDRMSDVPRFAEAREWFTANAAFHADVLARLRDAGPLLSKDIPDTSAVSWPSTGWTNNRNVTIMLELLMKRGEVAVSARQGRQRIFDLAERVYPAGLAAVPRAEADRIRDERRLRSLGIARASTIGEVGEAAVVDGSALDWRVDPDAIDGPFVGRAALLSPFDRLIHDRIRAKDLFDFEYILEMYKPAAARRWGYFALPVLHGDRLVGKLDVVADRKAGLLRVAALHPDVRFTKRMSADVDAEIAALAAWSGLAVRHV
ncbi:MAG: crosslink repair DNA glycosylase YcaQ family protein [Umezawaea sp.]